MHYTRAGYLFYRRMDDASARKLLYASFLYLPVALLALYLDKLLIP